MDRPCDVCGKPYEAKRASSRYCSGACRKRAQREGKTGKPDLVVVPPGPASSGELVQSVEKQLTEAARLDTWQGQAAVDLARRIEGNPRAPLSQVAAAHRELRAAVGEAVRGAKVAKSAVEQHRDQLAERRRRKSRA